MDSKSNWKHGNASILQQVGEPDAIVLFDDEDDSVPCDAIYYRFGETLVPIRTINRTKKTHWKNVLIHWQRKAPLEDRRANPDRLPLPWKTSL